MVVIFFLNKEKKTRRKQDKNPKSKLQQFFSFFFFFLNQHLMKLLAINVGGRGRRAGESQFYAILLKMGTYQFLSQ